MSHALRPGVRTAGAVLSAVGLMAALSGCGGAANGQESAESLSKVTLISPSVLTVCTDSPYPPFVFEQKGKTVGFDVDLGKAVADDLGVDLDVIDVAFDDITSGDSLNNDVCDVAISAMTITGERARVVDFSSPYFDAKQALVTPRGSGIDQIEQLGGVRVGVQAGTTGESYLGDFAPEGTLVVPFEDSSALQSALADGSVAAAMLDNSVSGQFVKDDPSLKVAAEFDTGEQYGMAVRKDGNIPLLREINRTLAKIRDDGEYDKIYKKYLG